jgi:hypothetical protein
MEGCPDTHASNTTYLILTGIMGAVLYAAFKLTTGAINSMRDEAENSKKEGLRDEEFLELQVDLYGERARELQASRHSRDGSKHKKK